MPARFSDLLILTSKLFGVASLLLLALAPRPVHLIADGGRLTLLRSFLFVFVRILVQAQPRRTRLLAGKVVALIGWTAAATTVATIVVVGTAPVMASVFGVSTDAWGTDLLSITAGAWLDTFLALIVWGIIGLVIAVLTRSSAVAITIGIGYVLVVENIVGLVSDELSHWLPGQTLTALAQGGTADVAYGTAVALGLLYATVGLVGAAVTFAKRDVLD
jgi:ABC-2 type transport system permease protein